MNSNASFILLVTLIVFIVDSEATLKQSREIGELKRKLRTCRDGNETLKKNKKLKKNLKICKADYNALNTKYLEAGEKCKEWVLKPTSRGLQSLVLITDKS